MTAGGLLGSARGVTVCVLSQEIRPQQGPYGWKKAVLILERTTVKSRQTVLVTELKLGLCHICFQGKWQKFFRSKCFKTFEVSTGEFSKRPAADSFRLVLFVPHTVCLPWGEWGALPSFIHLFRVCLPLWYCTRSWGETQSLLSGSPQRSSTILDSWNFSLMKKP